MAEVASAFVSLMPSARGFGSSTERQIGPQLAKSGKRLGVGFGKSLFGAVAATATAIGVGRLFSDSVGEAREAQKVGALTAQVIKTTGGVANVSAKKVGRLSTAISKKAGIDDEAIQSGANLLLTFKNVRNELGKGNKIFDRATRAAVDLSAAGFGDLSGTSKQLGKALNDPIKGITALGRAGVTFTEQQKKQIKTMVENGNALGAQKIILKEVESQVGGAAAATATAGDKAKVALGNLKESIGTALLPVIDKVSNAFTNKIAPALTTFVDDIGPAAGKVKDFFTNGAGAKPLAAAMGAIGDSVGVIKDGLGVAADNFGRLADGASNFDLGNIDGKALGKTLGTAFIEGLKFLGSSAGKITSAIGDVFGKVDWVGVGITIGKQAPALLLGLAAGILNFDMGSLLKGIGDHWFDILMGILIIAFAPSKFLGPLERILTKIPFVGRFLAASVRWLNDLGSKLTKFGGDLFRAFAKGFGKVKFPGSGIVSRVLGAFKALPGRLLNFWLTLETRLGVWALDAFEASGRGARKGVGKLLRFVGTIGGKIVKGLGDLAGILYDAGVSIIGGLAKGIWDATVGKLGGTLKAVGSFIKSHKGPPSADKVMLRPAGRLIIGGLIDGLDDGLPDLERHLRVVTGRIQSTAPQMATAASTTAATIPAGGGLAGTRLRLVLADGRELDAYIDERVDSSAAMQGQAERAFG